MNKIIALIFIVLLATPAALACTQADKDLAKTLPVANIYDPIRHENNPITCYSRQELSLLMQNIRFWSWNDKARVLAALNILYPTSSAQGRVSFTIITPEEYAWNRQFVDYSRDADLAFYEPRPYYQYHP